MVDSPSWLPVVDIYFSRPCSSLWPLRVLESLVRFAIVEVEALAAWRGLGGVPFPVRGGVCFASRDGLVVPGRGGLPLGCPYPTPSCIMSTSLVCVIFGYFFSFFVLVIQLLSLESESGEVSLTVVMELAAFAAATSAGSKWGPMGASSCVLSIMIVSSVDSVW